MVFSPYENVIVKFSASCRVDNAKKSEKKSPEQSLLSYVPCHITDNRAGTPQQGDE